MRRRRLLLGAGALALFLTGLGGPFAYLWLTKPPTGATRENFRVLRVGMSGAAVESLLGTSKVLLDEGEVGRLKAWTGIKQGEEIWLVFDGDDRLASGGFMEDGVSVEELPSEGDPSCLDRLRRLLPW